MSCQLLENEKVHIIQGSYSFLFLDDPLHCKANAQYETCLTDQNIMVLLYYSTYKS